MKKQFAVLIAGMTVVVLSFGFIVQEQGDHAEERMRAEQARIAAR